MTLFIIGLILISLGGLLVTIGFDNRNKAIMTVNGELNPFPVDISKTFHFQLAKLPYPDTNLTDIKFTGKELEEGIDMNQIFPAASGVGSPFTPNQLKIKFVDNKLSVSTILTNSNGTTIAQIVDNQWKTVEPSSLLFWDRNYNAYAFEIIGSNTVPTFQVIMVGPNRIQIGGLFYTERGSIYFQPVEDGAVLHVNQTDAELVDADIPTIFRYPALTKEANLGKMNDPYYPSSDPLAIPTWTIITGVILGLFGSISSKFGYDSYKHEKKRIQLKEERAKNPSKNAKQKISYKRFRKKKRRK